MIETDDKGGKTTISIVAAAPKRQSNGGIMKLAIVAGATLTFTTVAAFAGDQFAGMYGNTLHQEAPGWVGVPHLCQRRQDMGTASAQRQGRPRHLFLEGRDAFLHRVTERRRSPVSTRAGVQRDPRRPQGRRHLDHDGCGRHDDAVIRPAVNNRKLEETMRLILCAAQRSH